MRHPATIRIAPVRPFWDPTDWHDGSIWLMLPWLAFVKFRAALCRHDEGSQHKPIELPKVGGPLHPVESSLLVLSLIASETRP